MPLKTVKEMMPEILALLDEDKKIYVEDGYLILNYSYEYDIALDRLQTEKDILGWVFHLAGKNWMNAHRIQNFIEKCSEVNKIDYTTCG